MKKKKAKRRNALSTSRMTASSPRRGKGFILEKRGDSLASIHGALAQVKVHLDSIKALIDSLL